MKSTRIVYLWIFWGLIPLLTQGQEVKTAETYRELLTLERIEKEKWMNHPPVDRISLVFRGRGGELVQMTSFDVRNDSEIALLGTQDRCVCIGDTVTIELIKFRKAEVNEPLLRIAAYYSKIGVVPGDGDTVKIRRRRLRLKLLGGKDNVPISNYLVVSRDQLFVLKVPYHGKTRNSHRGGTSCSSCHYLSPI